MDTIKCFSEKQGATQRKGRGMFEINEYISMNDYFYYLIANLSQQFFNNTERVRIRQSRTRTNIFHIRDNRRSKDGCS